MSDCYYGYRECSEIATVHVTERTGPGPSHYIARPACKSCAAKEERDNERRAEYQGERDFHTYHAGLGPASWYR